MLDHQERPVAADQDPCALIPGLADLAVMVSRLGPLLEQVSYHLADRPTVTAHLRQARTSLADARRSIDHAIGTLDFNADCASDSPLWMKAS